MPVIKSAKKKLRQDKKRRIANKKIKTTYKDLLKETKENPSAKGIQEAFSSVDKAAKNGIIHPNKAARLKSALSKLDTTKTPKKEQEQPTKKVPRPSSKKSSKK